MSRKLLEGVIGDDLRSEPILRAGNTNCGGCGMSVGLNFLSLATGSTPIGNSEFLDILNCQLPSRCPCETLEIRYHPRRSKSTPKLKSKGSFEYCGSTST